MNRLSGALVALVVLVLTIAVAGANAGGPASDGPSAAPGIDTSSAIVQLNGDPLSTYVKTKPPTARRSTSRAAPSSRTAPSCQRLRNDFKQWLQANAPKAKVTGEYDIALNAVAVQLNGTSLVHASARRRW